MIHLFEEFLSIKINRINNKYYSDEDISNILDNELEDFVNKLVFRADNTLRTTKDFDIHIFFPNMKFSLYYDTFNNFTQVNCYFSNSSGARLHRTSGAAHIILHNSNRDIKSKLKIRTKTYWISPSILIDASNDKEFFRLMKLKGFM